MAVFANATALLGKGLYTVREASKLTRVPIWSIRRWSQGYTYKYRGSKIFSKPAVATDIDRLDGQIILSFADLMELLVLDHFLNAGVSWKTIRIASQKARDLLSVTHPFSTRSFKTDKHTILFETASDLDDRVLLNMLNDQFELSQILDSYLVTDNVEFVDNKPLRWWPGGRQELVVVDPNRSFGAPIIEENGIQTLVLKRSFEAEKSIKIVAQWFKISEEAVKKAVAFEKRLAA
jgi:uncharacterized protein (DUF433 family)